MSIVLKNEFDEILSQDIKSVIRSSCEIAEKSEINIYLIGGIVRDLILNHPIKDIDIAVENDAITFAHILTQELDCEIEALQENLRTAKVKFKNGIEIDFASTREEYYSKTGNLPVAVNFGCKLELDVKRRDFTINTLAIKLTGDNKFQLVDFYNGFEDIKNKKIKILHDNSFIDDPSRIIRALKFQKRFNFDMEEKTYNLMQEYLNNPNYDIPYERIKSEFKQYCNVKADNLYNHLIATNVFKLFGQNPFKNIEPPIDWLVYLMLLTINNEKINDKLNLTAEEKNVFYEIKQLLNTTATDNFEIYNKYIDKNSISLTVYYLITQDETVNKFLKELKDIKVLTTGKDLIELGFTPSKEFNEIFNDILKQKLNGKLLTKEEEEKYLINQFNK